MHYCIIGCGAIARTHARHLARLPGAELSFASRSPAKAEEWRRKWCGTRAYGSYEAAFADPAIDAVVICTPHDSHAPLALAALGAGKHAVIEKPMACTTADADAILATAESAQRQVLVAENHHYRPHVRRMAEIARSGKLGRIKFIRIHVLRNRPFAAVEWRGDVSEIGGGALIDGGIHWINAMLTLADGALEHLSAYGASPTQPGEDSLAITCRFASGELGVLAYSWGVRGAFPQGFFSIHGSRGSAYCSNGGRLGLLSTGGIPRPLIFPFRDWQGYVAMWRDFHDSLSSGRTPAMDGVAGRRDIAVVETIYRQIAQSSAPGRAASAS